ncbi:MAG: AAA family ATPase [Deltaproteobacteria bacterium]|nr:AAA family ATPase [Deltaproteobacteria bacterium]
MKRLPLNDPPFRKIIEKGLLYADKTAYIHRMLEEFTCCFLSRPRRFGKTLLVDTLEQLFREDGRELFRGLEIESSGYGFEAHPVVRITMSSAPTSPVELKDFITFTLETIADSEGLTLKAPMYSMRLQELIRLLHAKRGKGVVVLIDEYDAPVAGHLDDMGLAEANAKVLRGFFEAIKLSIPHLRFAFCTGITRFALTSMGTVPNPFTDISLDEEFAGICGFTVQEFEKIFADRMAVTLQTTKDNGSVVPDATEADLAREILDWYDGYVWGGDVRILNPFSIVSFFRNSSFEPYWAMSGDPTHLVALMQQRPQDFVLPRLKACGSEELQKSMLGRLEAVPALFQAGYLTVERARPAVGTSEGRGGKGTIYSLRTPNLEVRSSYEQFVFKSIFDKNAGLLASRGPEVLNALAGRDPRKIADVTGVILSSIPHRLHSEDENYYHAAIHSALVAMGFKAQGEVAGADGQSDEAVHLPGGKEVLVIEVKHRKLVRSGLPRRPGAEPADAADEAVERELDGALDEAEDAMRGKRYDAPFSTWDVTVIRLCLAVHGRRRVKARFLEDLPPGGAGR